MGIFLMVFATGCRTPEEAALKKRKGIFQVGKKKEDGAQPGGPTGPAQAGPGWNPNANIAVSGTGRQNSYSRVPMSQPYIAMTFDDGPHPTNTPRLLDMMKQRNIRATFFVVGSNARRYPHILRRMIAEGHEIANHTDSHAYLTKLSPDGIRRELSVTHQAIVAATGVPPRVVRPPYGAITADQKAWIKSEFGYPSILWSVDPEDWKRPGSSVVTRRLVSGASPGGILLAHDIHPPTIDAMPATFDQLLAKGYRFITVSQLISLEGQG
ncbi:MAG: polysaccharide deacetylase family protein [Verrucomicrobiae bacterium]|nr:polysaccharide deacetylase family protein [Verrucomicrobiae bacterium]